MIIAVGPYLLFQLTREISLSENHTPFRPPFIYNKHIPMQKLLGLFFPFFFFFFAENFGPRRWGLIRGQIIRVRGKFSALRTKRLCKSPRSTTQLRRIFIFWQFSTGLVITGINIVSNFSGKIKREENTSHFVVNVCAIIINGSYAFKFITSVTKWTYKWNARDLYIMIMNESQLGV